MTNQIPWYLQESFKPVRIQNLVGWWNSSSWDGMTWRNLAPNYANVNHGTLTNGVAIGDLTHPSGVFGAGLKFDGTDDYSDHGNDASLNITDSITIESWIKSPDWSTPADDHTITRKDDVWAFGIDQNGKVGWYLHNGGWTGSWQFSQNTLSANIWHHVIGVRDGNTMKVYIDGVQDPNTDTIAGSLTTNTDKVAIGTNLPGDDYFNGTIDVVMIYNTNLQASEIMHNYTHSPRYYLEHGILPESLLKTTSNELARVVV